MQTWRLGRSVMAVMFAATAACVVADAPYASLFEPGIVSTEAAEVRLAISPDGGHALWGRIGDPSERNGWEIMESRRGNDGRWSAPRAAALNSSANDFDPTWAPDGRSVLFFSNRPGGAGGDDIWEASFDPPSGRYGPPRNLGPNINTPGNEWAPGLSGDGRRLLFSSNGHGGKGRQDLFVAKRRGVTWARPAPLGAAINTSADEFDASFVGDDRFIVYASGDADNGPVQLMVATRSGSSYAKPRKLPQAINCSDFVIGPSASPGAQGRFFWSARCPGGRGRMDIWTTSVSDVISPAVDPPTD